VLRGNGSRPLPVPVKAALLPFERTDHTGDSNAVSILGPDIKRSTETGLARAAERFQLFPYRRHDVRSESTGVTDSGDLNNVGLQPVAGLVVHEHTAG